MRWMDERAGPEQSRDQREGPAPAHRNERATPFSLRPLRPRSRKYIAGVRPHIETETALTPKSTASVANRTNGMWSHKGRTARITGNGHASKARTRAPTASQRPAVRTRPPSASPASTYSDSRDMLSERPSSPGSLADSG